MATKRTILGALTCALLLSARLISGTDSLEPAPSAGDSRKPGAHRYPPRPAHGGDVRLAGPFWLEMLVAKGSLTVYVTDRSGAPVDTSGGKGMATAHTDGKGTGIELRPAGGNRLAGTGQLRLKRSTVVFVTARLRGEKPHRAVFRPLETVAGGGDR